MSINREISRPAPPQPCGGLPASGYCGIDGYNKSLTGQVSATLSGTASDFHHVHGVLWRGHRTVSTTNSNGGHVMGAITAVEYKGGQQQKDKSGGYVFQRLMKV